MLSSVVFITLLASIAAFAPMASKVASLSKMRMSYETEVGVLPPVGFWDPLGTQFIFAYLFLHKTMDFLHINLTNKQVSQLVLMLLALRTTEKQS